MDSPSQPVSGYALHLYSPLTLYVLVVGWMGTGRTAMTHTQREQRSTCHGEGPCWSSTAFRTAVFHSHVHSDKRTQGHRVLRIHEGGRMREEEWESGEIQHRYREREDRETQRDKEKKNLLKLKERIFKIWQERQNNTLQKSKLYLLVFICWGCQMY